jgi:uncharacterized surface anchored protein
MKIRCFAAISLLVGTLAFGYQGDTATVRANGAIEGQIFSASTGAPLKKVTVRLTSAAPSGGRGMAMGQGQGQGQGQGVAPQASGAQAQSQGRGGRGGAGPAGQQGQTPTQPGQASSQSTAQTQLQGQAGVANGQTFSAPANASRTTDETGRFSFTNLAAGQYRISAERQGYLRQSYGARKYNTSGTPITLRENQQVRDLMIRMNPQSVIVGKVVDEDSDPMVGLEVRAMKSVYRNGKKTWSAANTGETNDIGVYRIPELDPGEYIIATVAQNPGRGGGGPMGRGGNSIEPLPQTAESIYAATYFPNSVDSASAVPVNLTAGSEMSGIDIHLRKTRVFRVRGKVANVPATAAVGGGGGGRGGGMGGASVMVNLMSVDGTGRGGPGSAARAPDYAFEIRGVSPGSYILMASTNGGGGGPGGGGRGGGGSSGGVNGMMAVQQVNVGSNHVDGLVLQLAAGAEIQGTIKVEGSSNPVSLPNVNVTLRSASQAGAAPRARVTDDSKFALAGVSPLPYSVALSGIPENCFVKSIRYGGQEVPEDGMSMAAGGVMEIVLSATAGSISATIADSSGNPVQNATVALYPKDGPITAAKSASTNESGTVTFKGLKPGDYRAIAWEDIPSGAYLDPVFLKPYETRGESVKVGESGQAAAQIKVITAAETDK